MPLARRNHLAKPDPIEPVWRGADDAIVVPNAPQDNVWAPRVLKRQTTAGAEYWLYYASATDPNDRRIALARLTQGTMLANLTVQRDADTVIVRFDTGSDLPVGGSVLITFPPQIDVTTIVPLGLTNFAPGAELRVDPAAVTDAVARGVARGALLVDLSSATDATIAGNSKEIRFQLLESAGTVAGLVQTFTTLRVLEQGVVTVPGIDPPPTNTPTVTATASAMPTTTSTPTNAPDPNNPYRIYLPMLMTP
ncbi:MAG: hypothetical protein HC822_18145 [Oscillochloris sp.]|nr:hypothetical protein [Oscillochloris sp.]